MRRSWSGNELDVYEEETGGKSAEVKHSGCGRCYDPRLESGRSQVASKCQGRFHGDSEFEHSPTCTQPQRLNVTYRKTTLLSNQNKPEKLQNHTKKLVISSGAIAVGGCRWRVTRFSLGCCLWCAPGDGAHTHEDMGRINRIQWVIKKRHEMGVGRVQESGEEKWENDDDKGYTCMKFWKN